MKRKTNTHNSKEQSKIEVGRSERLYLMDAIDYDTDIEPYRFVKIYSGVGSGKNYFIDALAKGGIIKHRDGSKLEAKSILLITSRRAKVDEQLKTETADYDPQIGLFDGKLAKWYVNYDTKYEDYFESPQIRLPDLDGFGESCVYLRNCAITNAKIENYFRGTYTPYNSSVHPWERFDIIVIDEAHSLLADASYQSAPFYVRRLIEETLKRSEECKVIAMTGSPTILNQYSLFDSAHEIDRMNICKNIVPNRIEFVLLEKAYQMQKKLILSGTPFVAFFSHIKPIFALIEDTPLECRKGICASFSKAERLNLLEKNYNSVYEQTKAAEAELASNQRLPESIRAFLSTAKNKEGINIKNEEFRIMFVEAHNEIDVVQMCGRLRSGVDVLYVVVDSLGHFEDESEYEDRFSQYDGLLKVINEFYNAVQISCKYDFNSEFTLPASKSTEIRGFIEFIHGKFPYIRFDYISNSFTYYYERKLGKEYYFKESLRFDQAIKTTIGLKDLAQSWYADVNVIINFKPRGDMQYEVDCYLERNHWLDGERKIRDKERTDILRELNRITGSRSKTLGSLLKQYGYEQSAYKNKNSLSRISRAEAGDFFDGV